MADTPTSSFRSTFVTTIAWVFIVLAGFATVISIFQNIMIAVMFPQEEMREAANANDAPAFARFIFAHPQVLFGAFLAVSATTFISSIGLLKRQNWARLIFIAILLLGILWNIGSLALVFFTFSSMPQVPDHAPAEFETMWKVMMGFSVVIVLAFAGLFGWIIKRLVSPEIKREFLVL